MKKVIAMIHFTAPPVVGGVESTLYHHARLLAEAGYEVHTIAGRGEVFHPRVKLHRVWEVDSRHPDVLKIGEDLQSGSLPPEFDSLRDRLEEQLVEILEGIPICIVHNAITLHKNLLLTAALHEINQSSNIRFIAWCHDLAWMDELYSPALHSGYPWELLCTPWPGVQYVTISRHQQEKLARLLNLPIQKIWVVPPGVDQFDLLRIEPLTRDLYERLNLTEADPLVLLPARITRRKNIEFALQVMAALTRKTDNPVLLVTGPPGPHDPQNVNYFDFLLAMRSELGLNNQVRFLYEELSANQPDGLPDTVVADLFRLADLVIFPSLREGFGIPVLEAGLARTPVFAADIPPVRESAGQFAFLFEPQGEAASVASQITEFIANDRAYQMRRRVRNQYTWEKVLEEKILPLIEGIPDDTQP